MFEPVIQANDSLVLNGDFSQGMSDWTRGANPREVSVVGEEYEGVPIRLLSAANLGAAWQQVSVPVEPGASARYVLSFLYETRHTEAGRMLIHAENGDLLKEIPLPPGSPRNLEEDQARLANGQPLVFKPFEYNASFDLPLQRLDKIRVTIVAPGNADPEDYNLRVLITWIRLALHLEPLKLKALKLDKEQLPPGRLIHLCLGADGESQHRLECIPESDSPWLYTKAALTSGDNPQGAIISAPDWGIDQALDSPWNLRCPMMGNQDSYLFTMNWVNQYTAAPYPMQISLGHHRLVFLQVQEAAYYPVRELAQSVRLGVRVASWYTSQFLSGRTVTWAIDGQGILNSTPTDPEGWAYFDYQPGPAAEGLVAITASVASPYYAAGVETTTLNVTVLTTDPWKDVLAVAEGNALPWAQKTGYPNRGSTYRLIVQLPQVLRGTELAMRWEGDSAAELGVQVRPELDEMVPVDTTVLSWELICRDELDGRFHLQLSCSKLLLLSDRKPMSLGRNLVRIGEVQEANKFPVVDERESVLLRVQVVHVVTSGDGEPVNNALVDWETPEGTTSTRSGLGGWASVLYQPTQAGDLVVTARVRAHDDAGPTERPFAVKALASSPWKDQVRISLDDVEVNLAELGLLCWRGALHTLRVEPTAGSLLLDQMVTLQWRGESPAIGLTVGGIGEPLKLESKGLEWTFSSQVASSISSLFNLTLSSPVFGSPRELFGRLISTALVDELTVMLDQVTATTASQTLFPCIGATHDLRYLPNALSPLVGLHGTLKWLGTPADELGASVEPPLDIARPFADGGIGWTLDFTGGKVSGDFLLGLDLPALNLSLPTNPMQLGHNKLRVEDWRESAVDAVIYKDKAWSWVRVVSAFTGQAVAQAAVQWRSAVGSDIVASDDLGWSGFGLVPDAVGRQEVVANVLSPFDGYEEQRALSFVALARDPWEEVRVRFDGHGEQPWGSHTYFPRRKGKHVLELLIKEGNPLLEQDLTLGMTGTGPAELGLSFEPPLGVARRPSAIGLRYALHCDDLKDGGFALRLGAERLARLSPANAMSLGEGAQVLKITGNTNVQQVLDWEQELVEQVTVVSSTTGKPIAGVEVTWKGGDLGTVTGLTDFYGVATVRFKPRTPGAAVVRATVGDSLHSDSIELAYTLQEPREISELYEPADSRLPPDDSQALAYAKVVSARTGLPLAGVQVWWDFAGNALPPSVTDDEGIAVLTFKYSAEEDGVLSATVKGGVGGWDMAQLVYGGVVPVIESLTSLFTNIDLGQEVSAVVRVVSRADGLPLAGIKVVWQIPGQSLPVTTTDAEGKSTITLSSGVMGENVLVAQVLLGSSKTWTFYVFDPAHVPMFERMINLSPHNVVGSEAHIEVRIVDQLTRVPLVHRRVAWYYRDLHVGSMRSDADGIAYVKFIFQREGRSKVAALSITAYNELFIEVLP